MSIRWFAPLSLAVIACAAVPAAAQSLPAAAPAPGDVRAAGAESALRRLAMAASTAMLQGESAAREWPLYVRADEIGRVAGLQVAYSASISASPTLSRLRVSVNDRPIGEIELKGGEQGAVRSLKIPPEIISAGLNSVRVEFESSHRVDCSLDATYELWAKLDPAKTGLLLKASQAQPGPLANDLTDLAVARMSAEGATPIYVRSAPAPHPLDAERLARLVAALARSLRLTNPVVTFGAPEKGDAGFELAVGTHAELAEGGFDARGRPRLSEGPSGRPVLLVAGDDEAAVDQSARALITELERVRLTGTPAGLRAVQRAVRIEGEANATVRLADLGLDAGAGRGRRWARGVDVALPETFVASVYQNATLRLKGVAPGGLLPGSELRVAVNGVGAASLPLDSVGPIDLDGETFTLPFSLFHPGVNRLAFETVTTAPEDARCDSANRRPRPLVRLSPETTISFPHLPRLRVGPDIARLFSARGAREPLHLALPRPDADSLSAALTLIANLSAAGLDADVDVSFGRPPRFDGTGVIVGPLAEIPHELSRAYAELYEPVPESPDDSDARDSQPDPSVPVDEAGSGYLGRAIGALRALGFAYEAPGARRRLTMRPDDVLFADAPAGGGYTQAGFTLPRLATAPNSWLVIAAESNEQLARGMGSLAASGETYAFSGRAAVFDPRSGRIAALPQGHAFYTLPADWTFRDVQDAFAIYFSDNVIAYIGLLICLATLLSAATVGLLALNPRKS